MHTKPLQSCKPTLVPSLNGQFKSLAFRRGQMRGGRRSKKHEHVTMMCDECLRAQASQTLLYKNLTRKQERLVVTQAD